VKEGWHACAQFAVVISNPHDPTIYTVSRAWSATYRHLSLILTALLPLDAHHRFIAEECDWGFTRFSELRKLFHPQPGLSRPTIEDDSAVVSVYVRVLEDPTGVLWHNFVK
jgi:ubiquitin carboxyl-terminal hydrolase 7